MRGVHPPLRATLSMLTLSALHSLVKTAPAPAAHLRLATQISLPAVHMSLRTNISIIISSSLCGQAILSSRFNPSQNSGNENSLPSLDQRSLPLSSHLPLSRLIPHSTSTCFQPPPALLITTHSTTSLLTLLHADLLTPTKHSRPHPPHLHSIFSHADCSPHPPRPQSCLTFAQMKTAHCCHVHIPCPACLLTRKNSSSRPRSRHRHKQSRAHLPRHLACPARNKNSSNHSKSTARSKRMRPTRCSSRRTNHHLIRLAFTRPGSTRSRGRV